MKRTCIASIEKNEGEVDGLDEHGRGLSTGSALDEVTDISRCLRYCRLRRYCGRTLSSIVQPFLFLFLLTLDPSSSIPLIPEIEFVSDVLVRCPSKERRTAAFFDCIFIRQSPVVLSGILDLLRLARCI